MADGRLSALEFRGPIREGDFDLFEAVDESSTNPKDQVFSCVAICRRDWKQDDWPALGGTRWIKAGWTSGYPPSREDARDEAKELAMSMYIKNSILRKAERQLRSEPGSDKPDQHLFHWQGGKGVIWTPPEAGLTPHRLMCHGRLIEHLQGEYIGSKDQGVGTRELKWISCATRYTIGLGCLKDTGEATAHGILAGLQTAVRLRQEQFETDSLSGLPILVLGAGKVGSPLVGLLHAAGAQVYVFDPALPNDREEVLKWCTKRADPDAGATQSQALAAAFDDIQQRGRILTNEVEALSHPRIRIVSPNGGQAAWLSQVVDGSRTRTQILTENRRRNKQLLLILGAGNDQVSMTHKGAQGRDRALFELAESGILFVPDALVSPGGVIAVSHELAPSWEATQVNEEATRVVERSVGQVFATAEAQFGGVDPVRMYQAFEKMTEQEWS